MRSVPRVRLVAAGAPLLGVLIGACSGSGAPAGTATSSATQLSATTTATSAISSSSTHIAYLTNGDKGTTTRVPVGAAVDVTLTPDVGYSYSEPASSDEAVLRAATSTPFLGGGNTEFRAVQAGTTMLTAVENPNCLPRCGLPSRLWAATVVVTSERVP